jgi:hypothetical protein
MQQRGVHATYRQSRPPIRMDTSSEPRATAIHGCRSGRSADRAPARAWSSSHAGVSGAERRRSVSRAARAATCQRGAAVVAGNDCGVLVGDTTAWIPSCRPSLGRMLPTWPLTVASITTSRAAVSRFENPSAGSTSTCTTGVRRHHGHSCAYWNRVGEYSMIPSSTRSVPSAELAMRALSSQSRS